MSIFKFVRENFLLEIINKLVPKDLYQKRQAKKIHDDS